MKKQLFTILILSLLTICTLSCSKKSSSASVNTFKTFKDIIGSFSNTGFNVGDVLITDGAINITKSISNYGVINIILPLSPAQMQSNINTTLTFNNVSGFAGSIATVFPSVTIKITEREYDDTHDYTGNEPSYTEIDCKITYSHNEKLASESFIVHNAECCSVGNTMRSLFRR